MKRQAVIFVLAAFCMALIASSAFSEGFSWTGFGFGDKPQSKLKMQTPNVQLTEEEEKDLYDGKFITRLIDSPDGLKKGYLRFFAPFDPVTAYMIATNAQHFDLTDPEFPKSGSVLDTKRTFMPYTFDAGPCVENGKSMMYQLLVMPFVAPRKLCIERFHDSTGFPYESAWKNADGMCCQSKADPELKEKYFDKAVTLKKNIGCWHISPLPKKFLKTEADYSRSDLIYYVDTNPGGNLSAMAAIVNKAQSTALPAVGENVIFHGKRWDKFVKKYYGDAMLQKYLKWKSDCIKAIKER